MAGLINCRINRLIESNILKDRKSGEEIVSELLCLYNDPAGNYALQWKYGIDNDVLNEEVRYTEVKNWIKYLVQPYVIARNI